MRMHWGFAILATLAAAACSPAGPTPEQTADAIYTGGPIVTVNDAQPSAEALAVKDGKILAVGARAEVESVPLTATGPNRWIFGGITYERNAEHAMDVAVLVHNADGEPETLRFSFRRQP